jgi:hypothetical protein
MSLLRSDGEERAMNFERLRHPGLRFGYIRGVCKYVNGGVGSSLATRDAAGVPDHLWHELPWVHRTDELMRKAKVPLWKRFLWRRGVDATAWGAIREEALVSMRENLRGMRGGPICLIGHSWGGIVLIDLLRSLTLDPIGGVSIAHVITVSSPGWNRARSHVPFPSIPGGWCNIRNRFDPLSGSLNHIPSPDDNFRMEDICVGARPWWRVHTGTLMSKELIDLIRELKDNGR